MLARTAETMQPVYDRHQRQGGHLRAEGQPSPAFNRAGEAAFRRVAAPSEARVSPREPRGRQEVESRW